MIGKDEGVGMSIGEPCGLRLRDGIANMGSPSRGGRGFMVIITSQIDSFRASMRTVILIKVVQELILLV